MYSFEKLSHFNWRFRYPTTFHQSSRYLARKNVINDKNRPILNGAAASLRARELTSRNCSFYNQREPQF